MVEAREIICIICPKGCNTKVWKEKGAIKIEGKLCKKGKVYVQQESLDPKRVLTSTVVVENSKVKRLPVRTAEAIPKRDLFRSMDHLSKIKVMPPIMMGDVIISNISDTGVNVIASDDLLA